jgi:23S rRNA pseudouridine1911/1915/1917 synthase
MTKIDVTVSVDLDGERADKVIATLLDSSRSTVRAIIDAGDACIQDVPVRPAERLRAGTVVRVFVPAEDVELVAEEDVPFDIVYEDSEILVVDKPAGVVVHPGSGRGSGTLVNGLIARYPDIVGVGQEGRWGIVHRLDRDTSGLLVVARTDAAYRGLIEMMKARDVSRRYLSIVRGLFTNTIGTIDAPIGRDPQNPTKMHLSRNGKSARTHYRRLAEWASREASFVSVTLETGRTHQIRVHMRSISHPIIGDRIYGRRGVIGDPGRTWLHARELAFEHPVTREQLRFISTPPNDLSDSLASLGEPTSGRIVDVDGEPL